MRPATGGSVGDRPASPQRGFREGYSCGERLLARGFDDAHDAFFQRPGLTTVRQPLKEIGETAARLLLARITADAEAPETVRLPSRLIVRESTGPCGSSGPC